MIDLFLRPFALLLLALALNSCLGGESRPTLLSTGLSRQLSGQSDSRKEELLRQIDSSDIEAVDVSQLGKKFPEVYRAYQNGLLSLDSISAKILPPPEDLQAAIFSTAYLEDEFAYSRRLGKDSAYAGLYRKIYSRSETVKKNRDKYEQIFTLYAYAFAQNANWRKKSLPSTGNNIRLPRSKKELYRTHPDAIDLYFSTVKREGRIETGPPILATDSGVVVAASGNWQGGPSAASYIGGGLSPKAGNAVILYNPRQNFYYYYAHLKELAVKPGEVIEAGDRLGIGGNTGINARKPYQGKHLHYAIYDANLRKWKRHTDLLAHLQEIARQDQPAAAPK